VRSAGPLLSTWDFWLNLPAERQFLYLSDAEDAQGPDEQVEYLAARGADAVKVWYIPVSERPAEEMERLVLAAGAEARRRGLPLIVHATELDLAKTALRAGAKLLVHSVQDEPVDEEFLELAREADAVYCPTLTVGSGYQRMYEAALAGEAPAVDDPNDCIDPRTLERVAETAQVGELARADGLGEGRLAARKPILEQRDRMAARNLLTVHRAGVPIAMGTDAGNPLTLHGPSVYAEMEAMGEAGLAPMEVLVAATRGGARALGLEPEIGTVEEGKAADLVVLAADPTESSSAFRQVRRVMRAGVLHRVEELAYRPRRAH
jgi:imidazolonepropionase-like amidohydrolase